MPATTWLLYLARTEMTTGEGERGAGAALADFRRGRRDVETRRLERDEVVRDGPLEVHERRADLLLERSVRRAPLREPAHHHEFTWPVPKSRYRESATRRDRFSAPRAWIPRARAAAPPHLSIFESSARGVDVDRRRVTLQKKTPETYALVREVGRGTPRSQPRRHR